MAKRQAKGQKRKPGKGNKQSRKSVKGAKSTTLTGAENVRWRLEDLFADHAELRGRLASAETSASAYSDRYRGKISELEPYQLSAALDALAVILDEAGRAYTYAYLQWVTDTADPERGAFLQEVKEAYTRISQALVFVDVEWARLSDEQADLFLEAIVMEKHKHFLELQRLHKEHVLSEPEEKVMSEMSINGRQAWNRFFDETISAMRFKFKGRWVTEQEILAKLHEPDRRTRRKAALVFTNVLKAEERSLVYIFNTLLADKASTDRLRGYESWISSRNQSNEVADETVDALVGAVTSRYDLVHRFYKLKRKLLGIRRMADFDRYAPVGSSDTRYSWKEARRIVSGSYMDFHERLGSIVHEFFEREWIDAAVNPGKRGGAFSHGAVPTAHPYILMNYTGRPRDVQTLAHELGHGVHQYLARVQGVFHSDTPLTTAETASVFGEMLTFQRLIGKEEEPANQLAMLVGKIDDSMATVFRQVTMNRFEDRVHTARREKGELTADDIAQHWMETQELMYGKSVKLTENYRSWWSYIPHFLHTPGYVYAYAFGELLVLALYEQYQQEGSGFADKYVDLLTAGGKDWPHNLLKPMGIDLNDLTFWNQGLDSIEVLIKRAEKLYKSVK